MTQTILFVSSENQLSKQTKELLHSQSTALSFCTFNDVANQLNTTIPPLIIVNFDDPAISESDLLCLLNDQRLNNTGIITISDQNQTTKVVKHPNRPFQFNRSLLYQQLGEITTLLKKTSFALSPPPAQRPVFPHQLSDTITLTNDPQAGRCCISIISNFLNRNKLITTKQKVEIRIVLSEMLMNAIEHGNCSITYEQKTEWLNENRSIHELIKEKMADPIIQKRKIHFVYTLNPEYGSFKIADEGLGFNWRPFESCTCMDLGSVPNGRGIFIARKIADHLCYNSKGNEVSIGFRFDKPVSHFSVKSR